jgi:hypothetical protein
MAKAMRGGVVSAAVVVPGAAGRGSRLQPRLNAVSTAVRIRVVIGARSGVGYLNSKGDPQIPQSVRLMS